MKKLIQTRLNTGMEPKKRGNCFSTVIACLMDLNSSEDVIQIQEYYKNIKEEEDNKWVDILMDWLDKKGYEWHGLKGHLYDGSYYLVNGETIRGAIHICIYLNGNLYHDPHPSNTGLTKIISYEYIGLK